MKYLDEYRAPQSIQQMAEKIRRVTTQAWKIMEVCGGQTHSIVKYNLQSLLPANIEIIHGPGCPVCVTPMVTIDAAIEIAKQKDVIFCTFADMLRVPGTTDDLLTAKAQGADLRFIYSPMDAVQIAKDNRNKQVVFFAIGFETTAPTNAMAIYKAKMENLDNFFALVSHTLVPPALEYLLSAPDNQVQGFLAAGHVCTIMGESQYHPLAKQYHTPIVITGFEPLDIMLGLYACIKQLEAGEHRVDNQYARCVSFDGNQSAQALVNAVFKIDDTHWRGIGDIAHSGLVLSSDYRAFDAHQLLATKLIPEPTCQQACQSGAILLGKLKPKQCPAFARTCSPAHPLGAPMVSSEGACHAYYLYSQ